MKSWGMRTHEVAFLLNPAFCGRVIYSTVKTYCERTNRAFPFPLTYLILPLVLHKETRSCINCKTKLLVWVQRYPQLLIDFSQRTRELGDIIDYCLGGESCNIAVGVVRDNVAWYGLLLQFEHERMFVARKNPDRGQQSTGYCYFEVGEKIEVPEECNFGSNANVSGIEKELTGRIRISENLNVPPEGQSRLPLSANIRHSLYYCIQGQDEIAAKNFLFHHQSDDFITQAIKDTIPYFLGAISEDALALENGRYILNRKLKLEKRKLEENRYLMGGEQREQLR